MGSSRHNFAASPLFPNQSTPLDRLIFYGSNDALRFRIGAVGGRRSWKQNRMSGLNSAHHFLPRTQPQTPTLTCLNMRKIGPHPVKIWAWEAPPLICALRILSGEADVRKHVCSPLPTLTLNRPHYKSI